MGRFRSLRCLSDGGQPHRFPDEGALGKRRQLAQALDVEEPNAPSLPGNDALAPKLLHRPVDVDGSQPGALRNMLLGQRPLNYSVRASVEHLEATVDVQEQRA